MRAGTRCARVVHAGRRRHRRRDRAGARRDRRSTSASRSASGWRVTDLLVEDGRAVGVRALDAAGAPRRSGPDHTVVATGGAGQCFAVTTNPVVSRPATASRWRCGPASPWPTWSSCSSTPPRSHHPSMPRPLLSEALRGEGAVLRDDDGFAFMTERAPAGRPRAPRRRRPRDHPALHRPGHSTTCGSTPPRSASFAERFPTIWRFVRGVGLDPSHDLLPGRTGRALPLGRHRHRPRRRHATSRACGRAARRRAAGCTAPTGSRPTRCSTAWCSAPGSSRRSRRGKDGADSHRGHARRARLGRRSGRRPGVRRRHAPRGVPAGPDPGRRRAARPATRSPAPRRALAAMRAETLEDANLLAVGRALVAAALAAPRVAGDPHPPRLPGALGRVRRSLRLRARRRSGARPAPRRRRRWREPDVRTLDPPRHAVVEAVGARARRGPRPARRPHRRAPAERRRRRWPTSCPARPACSPARPAPPRPSRSSTRASRSTWRARRRRPHRRPASAVGRVERSAARRCSRASAPRSTSCATSRASRRSPAGSSTPRPASGQARIVETPQDPARAAGAGEGRGARRRRRQPPGLAVRHRAREGQPPRRAWRSPRPWRGPGRRGRAAAWRSSATAPTRSTRPSPPAPTS